MRCTILLFILAVLFAGCTKIEDSPEYRQVSEDRDSLFLRLEQSEKELKDFALEFRRIEQNLASIDTSKWRIREISESRGLDQKDRIHRLIADIYITLDRNQTTIRNLESRIRQTTSSSSLQTLLSSLKANLKSKEDDITRLEAELSALKLEVKNLRDAVAFRESELKAKDTLLAWQDQEIRRQKEIMDRKEAEMAKVYFLRGTSKELIEAGILKKEGGLAGIGTVKVLGEKLGKDQFKVLHAKNDQMLLIGRFKKKKVVTPHPTDSYFFIAREGQFYLKISYPDKFWSISRYLVVAVE